MKQLTCEMCGSTDLVKQDGVFVCQTCGCKYSIEEAKKMMVEGIVEVTGTVKVDNSERVNNMLLNARRAYNDKKFNQSQDLYASILTEEPNNAEAILYEGLSIGWQGNVVRNTMDKAGSAAFRAIKLASVNMEPNEVETFICVVEREILSLFGAYANLETEAQHREQNIFSEKKRMLDIRIKNASMYTNFDILRQESDVVFAEEVASLKKYTDMKDSDVSIVLDNVYSSIIRIMNKVNVGNFQYKTIESFINNVSSLKNSAKYDLTKEEANKIINKLKDYKNKKIQIYWESHKDERNTLLQEEATLKQERDEIDAKIKSGNDQIANLNAERVPAEEERDSLREKLQEATMQLSAKKNKFGMFKSKEKKECEIRVDEIQKRLTQLEAEISNQRAELKQTNDIKINDINNQLQPIRNRLSKIEKRLLEINKELTKER